VSTAVKFRAGDQVVYGGELPCGLYPGEHLGIVEKTRRDAAGDQVVTVSFTCAGCVCITQDILSSELSYAGRPGRAA
jgi:hypothetical protein